MTPTIYGFPASTYTRTARLVCEEAGVEYRLEPLEFKQPSHLALHPFGKMPILRTAGGDVIYETLAIAGYIDQALNGLGLTPSGALERARMAQWISVAIDYLYDDLVGALHEEPVPGPARDRARQQLERLERALGEQTYLVDDQLTLADLFVYPMADFALGRAGADIAAGLQGLLRWRLALASRPSMRNTAV